MSAFAIYRLPREDHYTLVEQTIGEPLELSSISELNGRSGFVLAPFAISADQPLLLIRGDRVIKEKVIVNSENQAKVPSPFGEGGGRGSLREVYHIDFANFYAHLLSGEFRKIVLARSVTLNSPLTAHHSLRELFFDACQRYPRMFICLVSTPKSGMWLTATPEILLSNEKGMWQTMALAGTMKLEGDDLQGEGVHLLWSTKNIQEQRIVASYITECLEQFADDFTEKGPYTVRAGNLVHLRSDFTFTLSDEQHMGDVLTALHPTPAVCGLPKRATFDFILQNEHSTRRYYSGFMGPLRLQCTMSSTHQSPATTHLYVSLRCMEVLTNGFKLYAGGGLLSDSVEEQEWQETEAKMETMRNLLYI